MIILEDSPNAYVPGHVVTRYHNGGAEPVIIMVCGNVRDYRFSVPVTIQPGDCWPKLDLRLRSELEAQAAGEAEDKANALLG